MPRKLLVAAAAGWIAMAQSGAACAVHEGLNLAAAKSADVVFVGRLAAYRDVDYGSVMRLDVSEVLQGTPPATVEIGWGLIMGPGPYEDLEVGTMLVIAATTREPGTLAEITDGPVPIDYWVQQAPCTDAYVLVADEATLAHIRAALVLPD